MQNRIADDVSQPGGKGGHSDSPPPRGTSVATVKCRLTINGVGHTPDVDSRTSLLAPMYRYCLRNPG